MPVSASTSMLSTPTATRVSPAGSATSRRSVTVSLSAARPLQQMIDNSGDREPVEQLEDRMDDLREDRQDILAEAAERTDLQTRMNDMIAFLEEMPVAVTEYSEVLARRLVERITIFDEKIVVELKSGLQMEVEE